MKRLPRIAHCFLGLAASAVLLAGATPTSAQQANVFIRIDNGFYACQTDISAGIHTASVWVTAAYPFATVRLSAVVPAGTGFISDTSVSGIILTGNSQTGATILFLPGCSTVHPVELIRITFFVPAPLSNVTWEVQPAPGASHIELTDCSGFPMKGTGEYSIYCDPGALLGPYNPTPPDGAVDVSRDQLLSFTGSANSLLLGLDTQFGDEDVVCSWYAQPPDPCLFPFDPGTLLPNTTYYWQAFNDCIGCQHGEYGSSDVWSFTTGDLPLATEQATWGRVKAMYRE